MQAVKAVEEMSIHQVVVRATETVHAHHVDSSNSRRKMEF